MPLASASIHSCAASSVNGPGTSVSGKNSSPMVEAARKLCVQLDNRKVFLGPGFFCGSVDFSSRKVLSSVRDFAKHISRFLKENNQYASVEGEALQLPFIVALINGNTTKKFGTSFFVNGLKKTDLLILTKWLASSDALMAKVVGCFKKFVLTNGRVFQNDYLKLHILVKMLPALIVADKLIAKIVENQTSCEASFLQNILSNGLIENLKFCCDAILVESSFHLPNYLNEIKLRDICFVQSVLHRLLSQNHELNPMVLENVPTQNSEDDHASGSQAGPRVYVLAHPPRLQIAARKRGRGGQSRPHVPAPPSPASEQVLHPPSGYPKSEILALYKQWSS